MDAKAIMNIGAGVNTRFTEPRMLPVPWRGLIVNESGTLNKT